MNVMRQWLCVIGLAASALAATGAVPSNIVVITLDTTRADRMGFLGSKRGLTPNLDAMAQQSAVFTRAYAQAPLLRFRTRRFYRHIPAIPPGAGFPDATG